jgi:hypothetical protein
MERARFDLLRISALDRRNGPWVVEKLRTARNVHDQNGHDMASHLHSLIILKIFLIGVKGNATLCRDFSKRAMILSNEFRDAHQSPFWQVDALCTALTAALLSGFDIAKETLSEIEEVARSAGRPDKFDRAIRIGSGELSPTALFAE